MFFCDRLLSVDILILRFIHSSSSHPKKIFGNSGELRGFKIDDVS